MQLAVKNLTELRGLSLSDRPIRTMMQRHSTGYRNLLLEVFSLNSEVSFNAFWADDSLTSSPSVWSFYVNRREHEDTFPAPDDSCDEVKPKVFLVCRIWMSLGIRPL